MPASQPGWLTLTPNNRVTKIKGGQTEHANEAKTIFNASFQMVIAIQIGLQFYRETEMKKFAFLLVLSTAFKIAHASPIIDYTISDNGDSTYTYDVSVTNNNSGELYFFGIDISHLSYDSNGWSESWMNGDWDNSYYGGLSDKFGTAWMISGADGITQGSTLAGFSFISSEYVTDARFFAWNKNMLGLEDANLFDPYIPSNNNGWEHNPQVSTVPLPGTAWLFGSALLGFAGFARRRSAAALVDRDMKHCM